MSRNELNLIPLPQKVEEICRELNAPPRLIAHLTLVHDVTVKLIEKIKREFPDIDIDEQSIKFGAATHDIGKAIYKNELAASGSQHEIIGADLLKRFGVSDELARFTATHNSWKTDPSLKLEDFIVALADKCWKGKRETDLEMLICERLAFEVKEEVWNVFITLDEIVQTITIDADMRLAWQQQFSVD